MSRGPDGPLGRPPACEQAARVLLASTLRGEPRAAGAEETILMVLESDPLGCLAEEPSVAHPGVTDEVRAEAVRDRDPGRIKEPRNIKRVNPVSPQRAKEAHIQGTVVLEATISTTAA
jgi:hypothetical protein